MKFNKRFGVGIIFGLLLGALLGILFQKLIGFENMLLALGLYYQSEPLTLTPQGEPAPRLSDKIPEEYLGNMQLFVLAGQSNMVGQGDVPQLQPINDRIYVFGNDYHWKLAVEPIDDSTGQVDIVSADKAGFGPASSFSSSILKQQPGVSIGLIPCAKWGSSITEWQRNLSDDSLYGSCLKRIRAASTMGKVAGILYFQGETDTLKPTDTEKIVHPNLWGADFTKLVSDWRSDLGQPNLPVIFAQIGANGNPENFPNWEIVQEQQSQVKLPFCKMVVTDDLTLKDEVHFTTESYQVIGERFAEAYLSLLKGQ